MTNLKHKDIFTKFMIEYDKANIASSYPSLTDYEIATMLDKAYLAIIAQKVTGNNPRRAQFEQDTKAIEDIRPLITNVKLNKSTSVKYAENDFVYSLPNDLLYYISARLVRYITTVSADEHPHNKQNISLMNHALCEKFMATDTNLPWMSNPVSFIEEEQLHVLVDLYKLKDDTNADVYVTYIKKPKYFTELDKEAQFELSDTVAEELINLAIVFATNTVESSKLQSQTSILSLES